MAPLNLLDLPDEILASIAELLRADFERTWQWPACMHNPLLQLSKACKRLYAIGRPSLDHTVRLWSGRQCAAFLQASRARSRRTADNRPLARLRVLHMHILGTPSSAAKLLKPADVVPHWKRCTWPDEDEAMSLSKLLNEVETVLAEVVVHASPTQAQLGFIQAGLAHIQCKTLIVWCDPSLGSKRGVANDPEADDLFVMDLCTHNKAIKSVRIPCVRSTVYMQAHILQHEGWRRLIFDAPKSFTNRAVADLLIRHRRTLHVGGLRISPTVSRQDIDAGSVRSKDVKQFYRCNPGLTLEGIHGALTETAHEYGRLVELLDWQVPELSRLQEAQPELPAIIASDGMWMDPDDSQFDPLQGIGNSISSLASSAWSLLRG